MILIIIIILIIFFIYFNSIYNYFYNYFRENGIGIKIYNKLINYKIISNYNQIIPNLWLGDYKSALDNEFLIKNNIKLIINCSKTLEFTNLNNIKKVRVNINDDRTDISDKKMIEYFPKVYNIINKNLILNNSILIHCKAGMQRSATIVALYLMKKYNILFKQAKQIIRDKRYIVFRPFTNFIKPIKYFENLYNKY